MTGYIHKVRKLSRLLPRHTGSNGEVLRDGAVDESGGVRVAAEALRKAASVSNKKMNDVSKKSRCEGKDVLPIAKSVGPAAHAAQWLF